MPSATKNAPTRGKRDKEQVSRNRDEGEVQETEPRNMWLVEIVLVNSEREPLAKPDQDDKACSQEY